jgi:hypothetical protein
VRSSAPPLSTRSPEPMRTAVASTSSDLLDAADLHAAAAHDGPLVAVALLLRGLMVTPEEDVPCPAARAATGDLDAAAAHLEQAGRVEAPDHGQTLTTAPLSPVL